MKHIFILVVVINLLLLTACSSNEKRQGAAAPIVGKTTYSQKQQVQSKNYQDGDVKISSYVAPEPIPYQQKRAGRAVELLQKRAKDQLNGKEYIGAVSSLERALRIEPRNALLWHQLAMVRMEQKQFSKAAELASKSNRYAAGDRPLKYDNWTMIAKTRHSSGNKQGAKEAEKKAALYR